MKTFKEFLAEAPKKSNIIGKVSKAIDYVWTEQTGSVPKAHKGSINTAHSVIFKNKEYTMASKSGTNIYSNKAVNAYELDGTGERIWVDTTGTVYSDYA